MLLFHQENCLSVTGLCRFRKLKSNTVPSVLISFAFSCNCQAKLFQVTSFRSHRESVFQGNFQSTRHSFANSRNHGSSLLMLPYLSTQILITRDDVFRRGLQICKLSLISHLLCLVSFLLSKLGSGKDVVEWDGWGVATFHLLYTQLVKVMFRCPPCVSSWRHWRQRHFLVCPWHRSALPVGGTTGISDSLWRKNLLIHSTLWDFSHSF